MSMMNLWVAAHALDNDVAPEDLDVMALEGEAPKGLARQLDEELGKTQPEKPGKKGVAFDTPKEKRTMTVDLAGEEDETKGIDEVTRNLEEELETKDIRVTDKRFWTQPIKGKTKRWTKNMQKTKLEGYKKTDLIGEDDISASRLVHAVTT